MFLCGSTDERILSAAGARGPKRVFHSICCPISGRGGPSSPILGMHESLWNRLSYGLDCTSSSAMTSAAPYTISVTLAIGKFAWNEGYVLYLMCLILVHTLGDLIRYPRTSYHEFRFVASFAHLLFQTRLDSRQPFHIDVQQAKQTCL